MLGLPSEGEVILALGRPFVFLAALFHFFFVSKIYNLKNLFISVFNRNKIVPFFPIMHFVPFFPVPFFPCAFFSCAIFSCAFFSGAIFSGYRLEFVFKMVTSTVCIRSSLKNEKVSMVWRFTELVRLLNICCINGLAEFICTCRVPHVTLVIRC